VPQAVGKTAAETKLRETFKISEETWSRIETVARVIGGDFGMSVSLGEPGKGSFFNSAENSITLDPLHVADPEKEYQAEFVVAHEGGHRAITLGPEALGIPKEKSIELYGQIGFGFGMNAAEDPADNDWWGRKFPGFGVLTKKFYDEQLKSEGPLTTPEIGEIIAKLGRTPRFAHFGSEMIRYWHTGKFANNLDVDTRTALELAAPHIREYIATIPGDHPTREENLLSGRRRFQIFHDQIWPLMSELVKKDLSDEEIRQLLEQKKDKATKSLSPEQAKELERAMEEALKEMAKKISESGKPGSEGDMPLPKLSPELREALRKALAKLSPEERKAIKEAAKKSLEKLDDKMSESLGAKLNPEKPLTHEKIEQDAREKAEKEAQTRAKAEREEEERKKIEAELEKNRNEYDRAYEAVQKDIGKFADDIDRLFQPKRHPRWQGYFGTGARLSLKRAMQSEAKPYEASDLWERKTIPVKRDFAFTILVDLSGSMRGGGKIEETFKGAVLLAEALSRVGLAVEVLGFQDELIPFKNFSDPMGKKIRDQMNGMPAEVSNSNPGGNNASAYNDDGYAVKEAAKRLLEHQSRDRFLVVLSDGLPEPSDAHKGTAYDLHKVISDIKRAGGVKLVGVGLGAGTEHVRKYYPTSTVVPDVKELPATLAELFEDILVNPNKY